MRRSVLTLLSFSVAISSAALEIRLSENAGIASGLPASATTAWLWVDHRLIDEAPLITHGTEITIDADADGQVELEVPAGISPVSLWVAVDLTTGVVATASPDAFKPPGFPAPGAPELLIPLPSASQLRAPARIVRALVSKPPAEPGF